MHDTSRVNALNTLAWKLKYNNPDTAFILSKKAFNLAKDLEWKKGMAVASNYLGISQHLRGNFHQALENYQRSLAINRSLGHKKEIASILGNMGITYYRQGDHPKALKNYFKALKITKALGHQNGISKNLGNIGNVYRHQGDLSKALEYYSRALKMDKDLGNKIRVETWLGNIGLVHFDRGDHSKALKYYKKALKMAKELGDKNGIARHSINIGDVYLVVHQKEDSVQKTFVKNHFFKKIPDQKSPPEILGPENAEEILMDSAISKAQRSYIIHKELNDKRGIISSLKIISRILVKKEEHSEALSHFNRAYDLADSLGELPQIEEIAEHLYHTHKKIGNTDSALFWHERYTTHKDSLFNEEKQKELGKQEARFEWQQKLLKQKKEKEKQEALAKEKEEQQNIIIASVSGGLLLVLVFAFFIYNRLRVTRSQKTIIEEQKELVEEKQREVMDSITYAQRIQEALLKNEEHESEHLPEHFIYFQPKELVSGDFYWAMEKQGCLYLAAADCTGHGVPGAFLTMLGNSFLNEINAHDELFEPARILDQLRDRIMKELGQTGEEDSTKDGMDISLVRINLKSNELSWAGANNPLWVITPEKREELEPKTSPPLEGESGLLYEVKADKQPIGYVSNPKPFTNHNLKLEEGDSFYLFSDGYPDQFGGPKGKKFKYKPMKKLLLSLHEQQMESQKRRIDEEFEAWKGEMEQVDDVCVIGVRI